MKLFLYQGFFLSAALLLCSSSLFGRQAKCGLNYYFNLPSEIFALTVKHAVIRGGNFRWMRAVNKRMNSEVKALRVIEMFGWHAFGRMMVLGYRVRDINELHLRLFGTDQHEDFFQNFTLIDKLKIIAVFNRNRNVKLYLDFLICYPAVKLDSEFISLLFQYSINILGKWEGSWFEYLEVVSETKDCPLQFKKLSRKVLQVAKFLYKSDETVKSLVLPPEEDDLAWKELPMVHFISSVKHHIGY